MGYKFRMKKITINAEGETSPIIENGSLVLLVRENVNTLGIFRYANYTEILNLIDVDLVQNLDNGVYLVDSIALKRISILNPELFLCRGEGEISILLESEMILFGNSAYENGKPIFSSIEKIGFFYESIYCFIEAFYPLDLKEKRQFIYKCPSFYIKWLKKLEKGDI
jgi:hypothetical protein